MNPTNLLFILSDQHTRNVLGCYGNSLVQTPNLDRLAGRGTRFTNAVTPCPICVPARAALATGSYVHQTGHWDNALPYHGEIPSWHHRLREQGHQVDQIGKLHFRSGEDDNGFSHEIEPLHVVEGIGDVLGSIREDPPFRDKTKGVLEAGAGDSSYLRYDARNAENAISWLQDVPREGKPWCLFVSFVCPHPPYIAPEEFFKRYPLHEIPLPPQWQKSEWPDHPAIDYFRRYFGIQDGFSEMELRRLNAAYYGVVSYLDAQIGHVLDTLEATGLAETTRILYSSDHGESLGARGLTGKFTMYEESVGIPMLIAGPGVPEGHVCETPVSLIDCFPTVLEAVGAEAAPEDRHKPGRSLWQIAQEPDTDRMVFSEYHALGTRSAIFMMRNRRYKYVHYVDGPPQLFNLQNDPEERHNLAELPSHQSILAEMEEELSLLLDPKAVDARAKADQRARIEACGGEEAIRRRGAFDNSPTPDEEARFESHA